MLDVFEINNYTLSELVAFMFFYSNNNNNRIDISKTIVTTFSKTNNTCSCDNKIQMTLTILYKMSSYSLKNNVQRTPVVLIYIMCT